MADRGTSYIVTPDQLQDPRERELFSRLSGQLAPAPAPPRRELPAAERVARRALVLTALSWRAFAEQEHAEKRVDEIARTRDWVGARGLRDELEPEEARLLDAEPWSWTERDVIEHGWASEGVGVLAWALGRVPLPRHDKQVGPSDLANNLGFLAAEPPALSAPALRPAEELLAMRGRLMAIHWRLRELGQAGPMDFAVAARVRGLPTDGIPLVDGDLAIGSRTVARAEPEEVAIARSIAAERHRAIAWVCGGGPLWSRVDLTA